VWESNYVYQQAIASAVSVAVCTQKHSTLYILLI
jgi:hypothetical protein